MDQSSSSEEKKSGQDNGGEITLPRRTFTMEFFVGLFTIVTLAAVAYLAVGLGGFRITDRDHYRVYAEFDNISGLKYGAPVEIAGVPVGNIEDINLKDSVAVVTLKIVHSVKLREDDIASIRTKGIIGDRYVKISRGAADHFLAPGDTLTETESVVDIEDIIGKIVHGLGGGDKEDEKEKDDLEKGDKLEG